jgi:hypothetical protein
MLIKTTTRDKICLKSGMADQELRITTTHSSEPISSSFQAICPPQLARFTLRLIGLTTSQTLATSNNKTT